MKLLVLIVGLIFLVGGVALVVWERGGEKTALDTERVVTTLYPWAYVGGTLLGHASAVRALVPLGVEAHDYEPTPRDMQALFDAEVVVLNGAGLDAWAVKLRPELEAKGVRVLVLSEERELFPAGLSEERRDPHFWMDPVLVARGTERIAYVLEERLPDMKGVVRQQQMILLRRLALLDAAYRHALDSSRCKRASIVVTHNAFQYLANRYGFMIASVEGLTPEAEPSPERLAQISDMIRTQGIPIVFFESPTHPRLADILREETGAQVRSLNPLEGLTEAEVAAGKDYESIMYENLEKLKEALLCTL